MPVNPYVKGGTDVPVLDGGTGASTAPGARTNLGALDETAHDLLGHSGLTGVGDLTTAAHSGIDHGPLTHSLLNVGSTTSAVAAADFAAGDGTRDMFWDASTGSLGITGVNAAANIVSGTGSFNGGLAFNLNNTSSGTSSYARMLVTSDGGTFQFAAGNLSASPFASLPAAGCLISTSSVHIGGLVLNSQSGNPSARGIQFYVNGASRWEFTGPENAAGVGHLIANVDNVRDIGNNGTLRPRTGYFGTSLNVGAGNTAVSVSTASGDLVAGDGTSVMRWDASAGELRLDSDAATSTSRCITRLQADGAGDLSIIHTSDSWTQVGVFDFTASGQIKTGSTATGGLSFYTVGTNVLRFGTNNTIRWTIDGTNGHLLAGTDNTYDIGASGATRPRTGYFGTSLNVGNGVTASADNGDVVAGDGSNEFRFDASNANWIIRQDPAVATDSSRFVSIFTEGSSQPHDYRNASSTATHGIQQSFQRQRGTLASPVIVQNGDRLGLFVGQGYTGSIDIHDSFAGIEFAVDDTGTVSASSAPGKIVFATTPSGTRTFTDRWRINNAGHFLTEADNTYDIGASGATRPRTGYFGTSLVLGGALTIASTTIDSTGAITIGGTNATALTLGRTSFNTDVAGDLTIAGNLTVNGTTTTVSTTNVLVEDVLALFAAEAVTGDEAGLAFERGSTGDDALILWNEVDDRFELGLFDTSGGTTAPTGALTALSPLRLGDALTQVAANGVTTGVLHASAVVDFASSGTASGLIPAGALVLGVTSRILTTVSGGGATDISTGDGVDADRWGTAGALTAGTTIDPTTYGDNTIQFNNSASAADVVVSGVGGTPTAGTVRVTVAYMLLTAPTS